MADPIKALRDLQRSYLFNTNLASVDLDQEDEHSVFSLNSSNVSFEVLGEYEEDADALARENLLRCQKHLQRAKRRYEHALRRLRQKGYCNERSLPDLLDSILEPTNTVSIASTTWSCIVKTLGSRHLDIEITDDMWFSAMDKLLILTNRRLLSDEETSIVPYCEDHILELYILLDDSFAQRVAQFTREDAVKTLRREEDLIPRADAKKMVRKAVEDFAATAVNDLAETVQVLESTASEKSRLSDTIEALRREKRQLEKECYALRKENGRLSEDLASAMFIYSKPGFVDAPPPPDEDISDEIAEQEQEDDLFLEEELPELPDTGIMFVGGHPNFLKKLRELYPNWIYLTHKNAPERMSQYGKLFACFICDEHMCHPLFYNVMGSVKSARIPYSYVKATNLDRAITEMRQDYAAILQEKRSV